MNKIKSLLDDTFLSVTSLIAVIGIALHAYQFIDSGLHIAPLIRLCFCVIYPVIVIFTGRKGAYFTWYIFANYLACTTTFQNYTAFIVIVVFINLVPKMRFAALLIYALEIFAIATIRDKTPVHIAIHICNCVCIYCAIIYLLKPTAQKQKLNLTADEIIIIEQLLQGKQQKEIEQFSQNTVTTKLKQARERNGIASTSELLIIYKSN